MKNTPIKILIVDDEQDIIDLMRYNFIQEGYAVCSAKNGKEAINVAIQELPDLIIIDIMMPEMDGIEACEIIRKTPKISNALIVFLSARNEEYSQIAAYNMGADDYITKPIKMKLLLGKIKSLLRRLNSNNPINDDATISLDGIEINRDLYKITIDNKAYQLPKKEFELFYLLASKPGKVFKREEILTKVWGNGVVVESRTIDVHIRKLREKIGGNYFKTIKGVGYKFEI